MMKLNSATRMRSLQWGQRKSLRVAGVSGLALLLSLAIVIYVFADPIDLTAVGSSAEVNDAVFLQWSPGDSAGTGTFNTFLRIHGATTEQGYNTDGALEFDTMGGVHTHSLLLSSVPALKYNGVVYREFQLDVNERDQASLIGLLELRLYTSAIPNASGYVSTTGTIPNTTRIYDLDEGADRALLLDYSLNPGSGVADYLLFVPESLFGASGCGYGEGATCATYVYLHSMFGQTSYDDGSSAGLTDDGFEEWAVSEEGGPIYPSPDIDIEKATNGEDADTPPGPEIPEGDAVNWTYVVTNTGNVILDNIIVVDDQSVAVTCPADTTLLPGVAMTCTASGTAVPGQYSNIGTATGDPVDENGDPLAINGDPIPSATDSDPSNYFGADILPAITVDKSANPTTVPEPGGTVQFTVVVANTSAEAVTLTSLVDDVYGDLNGQGTCAVQQALAASGESGDSYTCTFPGDVSGNADDTETDTVTATAVDDDGNQTQAQASAIVTITDVPSSIQVTKTADPTSVAEPGGQVSFSVVVENTSAVDDVTITSLVDDIHGDLDGQGDCSVPQALTPSSTYSCSFAASVTGNAGASETDVVTASGADDDGNPVSDDDDAVVTITDVPSSIEAIKTAVPTSVAEPGGPVAFTVRVNNTSAVDSVTIDSLTDDIHGDLNGQGTCSVPQTIAAGGFYECSFTANVTGNAGDIETDVVTASGTDDDGNAVSDDDDAVVTITDVPSSIEVIKTAVPTSVAEPGGPVAFTVRVNNTSAVDSVTIDSLADDIHGDLNGQGTCSVPQTIAAGGFYECSFTANVMGNAGDSETDVVTASGTDDDGNPVSDDDDALVTILDVPSSIEVIKTANPVVVAEPGGSVVFTVRVNNTSAVDDVTIDSLTDDVHGDLNRQGTCSVPQTIAAGGFYECSFSANVMGDAGDSETDVVTASGVDDDGNEVSAFDDATVFITDVVSTIEVIKTADPTSVPEPGGTVNFTVRIENTSEIDLVTIDSLVDDIHGDLNGQGTCSVPQEIAVGGFYECSFSVSVTGNAGDSEIDTVTASGYDEDEYPVSGFDDATVDITDVPSSIEVIKTADPTSVQEPGDTVTFSVRVENDSAVDSVTITDLTDDIHGNLAGQGTCSVPQILGVGAAYECSFEAEVTGVAGESETDTVTASGVDDDGDPVSDSDSATVDITPVPAPPLPLITIEKTLVDIDRDDRKPNYVTFTIAIDNIGETVIDILPLQDDYEAEYLVFHGADQPPDGVDVQAGLLSWDDLTEMFGANLGLGESFTLTVSFAIIKDFTSTTNWGIVPEGSKDVDGNDVEPVQDDAVVVDGPTAVDLLHFRVVSESGAVRLEWATAVEQDNLGFRLLRATEPDRSRASEVAFIPTKCQGSFCGAEYDHLDTSAPVGNQYWYWLASVDTSGAETVHGPVSVSVVAPDDGAKYLTFLPLMSRGR